MAEYTTTINMTVDDIESMLFNIERCLNLFDYITPNPFIGIVEAVCIVFLRGKGYELDEKKSIETRHKMCYVMIHTMFKYAINNNKKYYWFINLMERVNEQIIERQSFIDEGDVYEQ